MKNFDLLLSYIADIEEKVASIDLNLYDILKEYYQDIIFELEWQSFDFVLRDQFSNRYSIQTLLELIELGESKEIILEKARII